MLGTGDKSQDAYQMREHTGDASLKPKSWGATCLVKERSKKRCFTQRGDKNKLYCLEFSTGAMGDV